MAATGEVLLDLVLGDESGATSPAGRGIVEYIEDREPARVSGNQFIQLSLEQDILWVNVGIDEAELCLVRRVLEGSTDDLEHGSDPGSSSNHPELTGEVRGVDELALGAFNPGLVSNLEEGHMTGDITFLIGLAQWFSATLLIRRSHGP